MAVSEIVHPNDLDTAFFAAFFHSSLHGVFGQGENPAVMLGTIQAFDVVLDFLALELGHLIDPVAFLGFGICDHIIVTDALIGFVDRNRAGFKIEIIRG